MTLREQIARRLYGIRAQETLRAFDTLGPNAQAYWFEIADEVIRLMEWARRECGLKGGPTVTTKHLLRLTLPPEDWKP